MVDAGDAHDGEGCWFRPAQPSADLAGVLACGWDATVLGQHDLVPDGCIELLWIEERGLRVCGPDTTGWSFTLPGGTETSGLRFRPGAVGRIFGAPAGALVDQQVPVGDLLGRTAEAELDDAVSSASDGPGRLRTLERFLRGRLRDAEADPMAHAAALLGRIPDPIGRLGDVASHLGVSPRNFRRRFAESVGYGPAFFTRIVRLQRFVGEATQRPDDPLVALAADTGYADQAHLSRDCRELAGMAPRALRTVLHRTSSVIR